MTSTARHFQRVRGYIALGMVNEASDGFETVNAMKAIKAHLADNEYLRIKLMNHAFRATLAEVTNREMLAKIIDGLIDEELMGENCVEQLGYFARE